MTDGQPQVARQEAAPRSDLPGADSPSWICSVSKT